MTTASPTLMAQLDNPFWRFSLSVYQDEFVKNACLALQDQHSANVNMLLYCCWIAYQVDDITKTELLESCHAIDNWNNQVTQPLRNIRRWVRENKDSDVWVDEFSQQMVIDEIVSETYQQHILFRAVKNHLTKKTKKNEEQAILYLNWLFSEMNWLIDSHSKDKIEALVNKIFSMVPCCE